MLTGTPLPATTKDKNINVGGDLLQHLEDFTQKEPKQSLSKNTQNQPLKDNQSTTLQANQHLGTDFFWGGGGGMINGLNE